MNTALITKYLTVSIDDNTLIGIINDLPPLQRDVLILRCEDYGQSEVAKKLHISKRRVYPYFYSAIKEIERVYKIKLMCQV